MRTPEERLAALRSAGAVSLREVSARVESYSNDTWLARTTDGDDVVLRVCWICDRQRVLREAAVGAALPAEIGYPTVLGSGTLTYEGETITWMMAGRLSGSSLMQAWPSLSEDQRDRALTDTLGLVRRLHAWSLPAALLPRLAPPTPTDDTQELIGTTLIPLPLDRVRRLVEPAIAWAPDHRATVSRAWGWLIDHADLLPALDDPATGVLTHGDLHLGNVWWDGERVTGLLDLEWVRLGPGWLDLGRVLDNALAGDEFAAAHARMLAVLRTGMAPEVPELDERLAALVLAHEIRQILVWSPPGPEPVSDHPIAVIERVLDGL